MKHKSKKKHANGNAVGTIFVIVVLITLAALYFTNVSMWMFPA